MSSGDNPRDRLLIFIVAYNAEHHIESVLDRIPREVFEKYEYEILIIDDSSKDQTFAKARAYKLANDNLNLKVLFNPINQGYGGNQKLGYTYAINEGFDFVVLLHGDGQYAPEVMEHLLTPLVSEDMAAVFGSRMMRKGDALKGGMPYYKYIGNKILTSLQNRILKSNLSEFHSGYRTYAVAALKQIPFQRNSNDFHFDTQIIIQLLLAKLQIKEIPIPTFYGDEICHVNGIQYGWNVIKHSILSRLHQLSIFYNRAFDINHRADYSLKLGYGSSHTYAIDAVEPNSEVLEVDGEVSNVGEILVAKGCSLTRLSSQTISDAETWSKQLHKTELVLMLDCVERMADPESFFDKLRGHIKLATPRIIVTTPNVAFLPVRLQLFFGNFNYGRQGILDIAHRRLFTFKSLRVFFEQMGYEIVTYKGVPAPFPKAMGLNRISQFLVKFNQMMIRILRGVFSYQIYIEIKPLPVVDSLLELAISTSKEKAFAEAYS